VRRLPLAQLLASPGELSVVRKIFAGGGVAALPTETFYALAADPTSERGVSRIFEIKGRDDGKPLLVLFAAREQLERLGVSAPPEVLDRFLGIWPAPLTAVFPIAAPIAASRGGRTLAVRMPAAPLVRELLGSAGPLTGTSANRSGARPLADAEEIPRTLPDLELLIDGGVTPGGEASTIVDATCDPPRLIRRGAFPWPMISPRRL
jgi:L-threonylcarbamoyladenylate synthase